MQHFHVPQLKALAVTAVTCLLASAHAATLSPSTANSSVHDAQYGTTSKVASSNPQDGRNIVAEADLVAMMTGILPPGKSQMPAVDVKTVDGHEYVFTPVVAAAVANGTPVTSLGSWTVSRDGTTVCSACQGWASLTENGYWIGVLDATGQLANAWTVMVDGVRP